ncbi:MAG: CsbD family protein [Xanthobacteraceae bacterium]|nr:CsbD family protein [Xanthobacteraceae bacterium]
MDSNRVTGATKSFAGKAEGAFGQATSDAATEASNRARQAEGIAQKIYGQAKDTVKDAANDFGDAASGLARQAMDAGEDYYRDGSRAVAAKVREQPVGSLLLAGAAGFALALMLTRQPRRPQRWQDYRFR